MIRILLFTIAISILSCQSSQPQMDDAEFFKLIQETTDRNLKNEVLSDGWYEVQTTSNNFERAFADQTFFVTPRPIVVPANFIRGGEFENYQDPKGFPFIWIKLGRMHGPRPLRKIVEKMWYLF
ncbi:hypothetical protein KFE98_16115 [bacterium SCSIO 12741]|nr:hypothetical protein KFE98_16115 [bacterium SCSIO 12741]